MYIEISIRTSGSVIKVVRVQILDSRGLAAKLVLNFEIYSPGRGPVTRRRNAEENPED